MAVLLLIFWAVFIIQCCIVSWSDRPPGFDELRICLILSTINVLKSCRSVIFVDKSHKSCFSQAQSDTVVTFRHNLAPPGKWGGQELDQYLWITQFFANFYNFAIELRRPLQANLCVTIFTATPHKSEPAPEKIYLQKLLCSSFREIWGSVHFPERRAPLPPVASNFTPIIARGQQHIISNYYLAANWTISLNYLQLNNESLGMGGST